MDGLCLINTFRGENPPISREEAEKQLVKEETYILVIGINPLWDTWMFSFLFFIFSTVWYVNISSNYAENYTSHCLWLSSFILLF